MVVLFGAEENFTELRCFVVFFCFVCVSSRILFGIHTLSVWLLYEMNAHKGLAENGTEREIERENPIGLTYDGTNFKDKGNNVAMRLKFLLSAFFNHHKINPVKYTQCRWEKDRCSFPIQSIEQWNDIYIHGKKAINNIIYAKFMFMD